MIVGSVVYLRPVAFDLDSGEKLPFTLDQAGGGCGGLSASASYLFGRGGNPQMYPIDAGGGNKPLTTVTRSGCWINIIPAGRMVPVPQGSSGCSCPYAVQTSIGFAPRQSR